MAHIFLGNLCLLSSFHFPAMLENKALPTSDSLDCCIRVVGSWCYQVQSGHQVYTIHPRADGRLFFRQLIHAHNLDGRIDEHVLEGDLDEVGDANDGVWLKAQLTNSKTSEKEGVIRVRYDEATGTLLSVFNDGEREIRQSAARIAHDMHIVGKWAYSSMKGKRSVYSIEFGVDGQLCFKQRGNKGSFIGNLEEVEQNDTYWLMCQFKEERSGKSEGQMWLRYDPEADTIFSKCISRNGEFCVTAVRSDGDAMKHRKPNLTPNQTRSLLLQSRELTTSCQEEALDSPWTFYQRPKERDCPLFCGMSHSKLFPFWLSSEECPEACAMYDANPACLPDVRGAKAGGKEGASVSELNKST